MEKLITAIILGKRKDGLVVYCVREGATGIRRREEFTILFLFDWKKFDGKLDQIEGIFQSLERYFPLNLE